MKPQATRLSPHDPGKLTFRQTRWFEFFNILKAHVNDDGLARQLVSFMEENRMSIRNQFASIDCVALENFLAAKSLMDETLWDEVSHDFAEKLGEVSTQKKAIIQLRDESRYIMQSSFGPGHDFRSHARLLAAGGRPWRSGVGGPDDLQQPEVLDPK